MSSPHPGLSLADPCSYPIKESPGYSQQWPVSLCLKDRGRGLKKPGSSSRFSCQAHWIKNSNFRHAGNLQDRTKFSKHFVYSHEMLLYPLPVICRKYGEFGKQPLDIEFPTCFVFQNMTFPHIFYT